MIRNTASHLYFAAYSKYILYRYKLQHINTHVVFKIYIYVCVHFSVLCKIMCFAILHFSPKELQDYLIVVAEDPFAHLNRRRLFAPWSEQTMPLD